MNPSDPLTESDTGDTEDIFKSTFKVRKVYSIIFIGIGHIFKYIIENWVWLCWTGLELGLQRSAGPIFSSLELVLCEFPWQGGGHRNTSVRSVEAITASSHPTVRALLKQSYRTEPPVPATVPPVPVYNINNNITPPSKERYV